MEFKDKLRKFLDIPKVTEDGWKYLIVSDKNHCDEVKIVGYKPNLTAADIPSHIEGLPVGILSGLQSIPLQGKVYIPDTVHTIADLALDITKGITKITVPGSVQSMGNHAFDFSEALEEIVFADGVDLSDSEGLLSCCENLKKVRLPEGLTEIPLCFLSDCIALEEIWIPDSVIIINDCAFSYCEWLRTVHIPENLEVLGEMAFYNCKVLEEIQLPDGLERIEKSAFSGCENLRQLNIPGTVRYIGKDAFWNCPKFSKPAIPEGCEVHPKAFG